MALNHPYAGFKILVHQDANTIKKLAKAKSRPFLWTGLLFAFFIATISYFIISRQIRVYQNKIENQQQKLEASNEEIMAQNDELENQNTLLKELAEEKSILLGIMAHDLRNPLGGIESVVNLIDKIGDLTEDQEAYFSLLKPQVESAQQLISDVLEMNQLENKTQDIDTIEIDIDKFINDKISQFKTIADEKSIKLKTVNNETTLSCFTSHNELNRISDNLLSNAIKYTPIGKSITIETQIANNKLNINFIDEGAGIPQEELSLLFKKFSKLSTRPTNEEPSTGLGLYIVRLLSEKIGAVTSVKSEVGIGSTFTLSLPLK